ncbi:MAG: transcription elongation factor GreB [Pseudomonadota bacterium]
MSRYRPPRPPSSPYITAAGHQLLQAELTHLWKDKRPEVTRKVAEAAAQGDRSENAEYIYGKRQLREIDSRIQFLSRRLDQVQVIADKPPDQARIFFGAWVTLRDTHGASHRYRIVGADETHCDKHYISIDAPMARALIGRRINEEITLAKQLEPGIGRVLEVEPDATEQTYSICDISYD